MPSEKPTSTKPSPAAQPRRVQRTKSDWIGKQLQQLYSEALEEPIPSEWHDLVRRMNGGQGKGSGDDK